jgi:hypothetical protein
LRIALASYAALPAREVDDRPLARALEADGAAVEAPAWDDAAVDWAAFDAVLPRTTWDYMHRAGEFLAWAARVDRQTRLYNPIAVVRWNLDKTYLRDLAARGVETIPTIWFEDRAPAAAELAAGVAALGASRAFLKPIVGASAVGALRFAAGELAAASDHLAAFRAPRGWMLQPYLPAVERIGEVSAIFLDGEYSHGVRKIPVAGDFRVQDDYGANDAREAFSRPDIERAAQAIDAAAAILGLAEPLLYARADFLRDGEGRLLLVELELVEPSLFFRHAPEAARRLAAALLARLRR